MTEGGVVILGARSWIGFRIAQVFAGKSLPVVGTTSVTPLSVPAVAAGMPALEVADDADALAALVRRKRPRIVFNLLRGEDEKRMRIHAEVARLCANIGCRYIFASSALVFEGHSSEDLLDEDALPCATTAYGSFKAACENLLKEEYPKGDWQVLRFASIQGWSPWKPSRNEAFLRKLAKGDQVRVDRGIIQNRLLDLEFACQVRDIALLLSARGVMHLGAEDSSEEFDFLRRVAVAFGWPRDHVCSGPIKDCNIALDCARTHALTRGIWKRTETQTIEGLLSEPGLARYFAPAC